MTSRIIHFLVSLVELCRLNFKKIFSLKLYFTLKNFPLLLPSHNCINNSQCSVFKVHLWISQETQWSFLFPGNFSQSLTYSRFTITFYFKKWWAKMDSNHRPHDYQSCALASWAIGPYQLHFFLWWRLAGSNRWPPACKAGALPAELNPRIFTHLFRYIFDCTL